MEAFHSVYGRFVQLYDVAAFILNVPVVCASAAWHLVAPSRKVSVASKLCLVTGAGGGIGRQVCLELGAAGAIVLCVDSNAEANQETAQMVRERSGNLPCFTFTCDVSDHKDVEGLYQRITKDFNDVFLIVNSTCVRPVKPFLAHTLEELDQAVAVNLKGPIWVMRAWMDRIMRNDCGGFVSVTGLASYVGQPYQVAFSASKFALKGFMEVLFLEMRQELGPHNVQFLTAAVETRPNITPHVTRLPGMTSVTSTECAGKAIVDGVCSKKRVVFVPGISFFLHNIIRVFPLSMQLAFLGYPSNDVLPADAVDQQQ